MDVDQLANKFAAAMWSEDHASQAMEMQIDRVSRDGAELSMAVRQDMLNSHNVCHGGMIFSLADSALAFACNSPHHSALASSCTIEFIRPACLGDRLKAVAKKVHQGRRNGIYDIEVVNQKNQVIAQFRGRSVAIKGPVISEESL